VIPADHRLRVVVASAAFPKYDRNLNTGGDNERDTRYIVVKQHILHERLPIIPVETKLQSRLDLRLVARQDFFRFDAT
jgi:hypothetical protein